MSKIAGSSSQMKAAKFLKGFNSSSLPQSAIKKTIMNPEDDFLKMKQRFEDLDRKIKDIIQEHNSLYSEFMQEVKMPPLNSNNRNHTI
jgi:hypothetical protein